MSKKIKSIRAKKLGEHITDEELIVIPDGRHNLYTTITTVTGYNINTIGFYINGHGQMCVIPRISMFGRHIIETVNKYLKAKPARS